MYSIVFAFFVTILKKYIEEVEQWNVHLVISLILDALYLKKKNAK